MIAAVYNELLFRPLANGLVFLYAVLPVHDLGLAIILLTIAVRLLLFPAVGKSLRAQKELAHIQPELKKIQEQHKDNKEEQAKKTMELYRERGINPFSGCLPVLIQLPLLFALYHVVTSVTKPEFLAQLYPFTPHLSAISPIAFGFLNLAEKSIPLAVIAGISQFLQGYFMPKPEAQSGGKEGAGRDMQRIIQTQTLYVLPVIIAVVSFSLSAALPLYWTILSAMSIFQQGFAFGFFKKKTPDQIQIH